MTRAEEVCESDAVGTAARRVLPAALVVGALAVVVRVAAAPVDNPDTFFHLRFGREFLDGWSLRHPGRVTDTASAAWVPTQWLSQVIMAKVDGWFGLAGIAWLAGSLYVALVVALVLSARRVASLTVVAPVVVVALLGCSTGFSPRPQLVSYVATCMVVTAWLRVREAPARPPWLLVPMMWVWAMCHGMWPLGVVVSLVALVGLVADGTLRGRAMLSHAAVPLLGGGLGALATPVGPSLLPAVLDVSSRGHYYSEWASPTLTAPSSLAVLVLLAAAALPMARLGGTRWSDLALVGLAAALALYSTRTVPIAACLLAPLAAGQLQRLVGPVQTPPGRRELRLLALGAAGALAALAVAVPTTSSAPPTQPAWLAPALGDLPVGTRVFNDETLGGYLMWRYPELDFANSGYGDIYTTQELDERLAIRAVAPGWQADLAAMGPQYALLDPRTPLARALEDDGWSVLQRSPQLALLRPAP